MANTNRIKKIKLSNGSVYSIFDEGALRLNEDKVLCTGNNVVDSIIIQKGLSIAEIDDVALADCQETVLVRTSTGEIKQQNIRAVLHALGVITAAVNDEVLHLDLVDTSSIL